MNAFHERSIDLFVGADLRVSPDADGHGIDVGETGSIGALLQ